MLSREYRSGDYSSYQGTSGRRETRGPDFRRDPRDRDPRDRDPRDRDPRERRFRDGRRGGFGNRGDGNRGDGNRGFRGGYREPRGRERFGPRDEDRRIKERDVDAGLSKQALIAKYEKRFQALAAHATIDKFPLEGTKWGIKPKGFEGVTAQRAKLSGLFPLPDGTRAADGPNTDGENTAAGLLQATSKIDPLDSKCSRMIIVKDLDFAQIDYLKVVDMFDKFLQSVDAEGTSLGANYENARKTADGKTLVVQFNTLQAATLALCLNGKSVPFTSVAASPMSAPAAINDVQLHLSRPVEYVVQCLPPYKPDDTEVRDAVPDSPRKLFLQVDKAVSEGQVFDEVSSVCPLRAFKFLRHVGTKDPVGLVFVELFIDPKTHASSKSAVKKIIDLVPRLKDLPSVKEVSFSCITVSGDGAVKTSVQDCPIDFSTLKSLVRNEYVAFHPKLKVIQIMNAVTAADIADRSSHQFVMDDIRQEAESFGKVVSVTIPRPSVESQGYLSVKRPEFGKVYVEFDNEQAALKAIMGLAGRTYNDRTVLCAFYSHDDYHLGLV